jgi:hypothetical protein
MIINAGKLALLCSWPALLTLFAGCSAENRPATGADPCGNRQAVTRVDTGTVVVTGTEGECTIDFREVVTLRGSVEEDLPKVPVVRSSDGEWLSATYDPGEVAVWSAAGALLRTIGNGPGEGPGEFGTITDLVVDTLTGELYVFSGAQKISVYTLPGEYLRQITLSGRASFGVRLTDGTIVTNLQPATPGPFLVFIRGDSIARVGPPQRFTFPTLLRATSEGIWSAEGPWYEINRHALADGHIDLHIEREAPWYSEPIVTGPNTNLDGGVVTGVAVDSHRRLVVVNVQAVKDPNAPSRPAGFAQTPEERESNMRAYYDGVIEAFTTDGRLIASRRYDYMSDAPLPLNSYDSALYWYDVIDDDYASIQVLELVLAKKGDEE